MGVNFLTVIFKDMFRRLRIFFVLSLVIVACSAPDKELNLEMADIQPGSFRMGSQGEGENWDESPRHNVQITYPFRISTTEITNAQYEAFDPNHKQMRGRHGFSKGDHEAVIFVNYEEAIAFCNWLSEKRGKTYRLPTEAEWEYVCRAGTITPYFTGDSLPVSVLKHQEIQRDDVPVSLQVAQTPANAWGVYDMHGNVEEWCYDWYGPYSEKPQKDPVGYSDGLYRVVRGGSHNTPVRYLRSSNRMAMLPADKHWLTGFRVVEAELPSSAPIAYNPDSVDVSQDKYSWRSADQQPFFTMPQPYIKRPDKNSGVPFYKHNHQPAITWCDNGDLLAIWFSTHAESGREMVVLSSRLYADSTTWSEPRLFCKVPDRNMTGASLLHGSNGVLYHLNGVEVSGDWKDLAVMCRTSVNNGASWSKPELVLPSHESGHQVIAGTIQTQEGWLLQACDAVPGPAGGTRTYFSKDNEVNWQSTSMDSTAPEYSEGSKGSMIAGIHGGVVQLKNGDLMAMGRNNDITDTLGIVRMPMSISHDMGKTWTYHASEFPPINSGQRLVLLRLQEGPILLISFTHCPGKVPKEKEGMMFTDNQGNSFKGYGMFAAISYDEGKTWPLKRLLTDDVVHTLNGGGWTGDFEMNPSHGEPKGYLAITQTPDHKIHLLSSNLYYCFNLPWLEQ